MSCPDVTSKYPALRSPMLSLTVLSWNQPSWVLIAVDNAGYCQMGLW